MSLRDEVKTIVCKDWDHFREHVTEMTTGDDKELGAKEWIFRGSVESHEPVTSLERAYQKWSIPGPDRPYVEQEFIREVERKAFGLGIPLPAQVDSMWWVSLMQHYGAPTRLLDFSYSPYVAAFFAFERLFHSNCPEERPAVWAIQHRLAWERINLLIPETEKLNRIERSEIGSLDFLFVPGKLIQPFIIHVNAYYLHERLAVQQGVFVCPTNVSLSFEDNFRAVGDLSDGALVRRLILPREAMRSAFIELRRSNITRHSLFPDFGGLAESLATRLPQFHDHVKDRSERGV